MSKGFTFQGLFAPLSPLLKGSWYENGDASSREYAYYLKDYISSASFSRIRDSYVINGDERAIVVDRADVILERVFVRDWLAAGVFTQGLSNVLILDSTVGRCSDAVSLGQGSPRLTALHSNLFHSGTGVNLVHNTTNASAMVSRSYLHTNTIPVQSNAANRSAHVKCSYVRPVDLGQEKNHPQCIVDLANMTKVRRIWNTHDLEKVTDAKPYQHSYLGQKTGIWPEGYQGECGVRFWAKMSLEVENEDELEPIISNPQLMVKSYHANNTHFDDESCFSEIMAYSLDLLLCTGRRKIQNLMPKCQNSVQNS